MLAEQCSLENKTDNSLLIRNLHALVLHHNLNEAKLARITNIPQPTLHKILTGKTTDPRISTLKILADYFNTSVDELYTGVGKPGITHPQRDTQSVPIISWGECTKGANFLNGLLPSNWDKWLSVDFIGKRLYALVSKPSMEAIFPIGTVLIIGPQKKPKDGDLVVVYYPNSQEGTLRKLTVDGPNQLLAPPNPNLPSDELKDDINILGVVIQSRYTYE